MKTPSEILRCLAKNAFSCREKRKEPLTDDEVSERIALRVLVEAANRAADELEGGGE